jgi:thiazole synthase ThiGH ThiG subunit
MPLSWNEIKSRAISLAANPVSMAGAMGMATVAGLLAYLSKCQLKPMLLLVLR